MYGMQWISDGQPPPERRAAAVGQAEARYTGKERKLQA